LLPKFYLQQFALDYLQSTFFFSEWETKFHNLWNLYSLTLYIQQKCSPVVNGEELSLQNTQKTIYRVPMFFSWMLSQSV
jgi:hypothetical protein